MTQVIAGQYPRPSGNLSRSPDFDSANGGKDSPQKIHHRPIRQIDHILFLADRSKEPEQYSALNNLWGGHLARLTPGTHKRTPYICAQVSIPCRAGIPARQILSDHEGSPYISRLSLKPTYGGHLARLVTGDHEWSPYTKENPSEPNHWLRGVSKLTVL